MMLAVIPNGVDDSAACDGRITLDVDEIATERPLVLFVGRLSWKKALPRHLRF